jgi:GT2 family glycosyltransferase
MIETPQAAAILVLNCNGKAHLDTCFRSVLAEMEPQDQLYLVDNGSTDGSIEYVREHYPAVKQILFELNLGFAEAYDRAVSIVNEEVVVFLNNDVEVEEGWLSGLKSGLEGTTGQVAACGSKILFYNSRGLLNHAGGKLAPIGGGVDIGFMKPDIQDEYHERCVGCVSGASMIVPRSVFLSLGGFDPGFFAYFEDVDYCWRAWLVGFRTVYAPTSIMYHKFSATMGPLLKPERVFLGERNRLQTMLANLELRNLAAAVVISSVYLLTRVVVFLTQRRLAVALAVLRGNWWVLRHFPGIVEKRRHVQRTRRVRDNFFMTHGLMTSLLEGFREFARLRRLERELNRIGGWSRREGVDGYFPNLPQLDGGSENQVVPFLHRLALWETK